MPLYFQIYENYIANKERLDIPEATAKIDVPWLIVHGTNDTSVPYTYGKQLDQLNKNSAFLSVENGDHTFGGKHPWLENELPADAEIVIEKTITFFKN